MLIILMIFLIISSILVLIVKRNKETFYIFSMSISLTLLIIGIMLYIAKKGGISSKLQDFYFFNTVIKTYVQYFYITLDTLGYLVAVGRYLFPLFLLLLAIHYSNTAWLNKSKWLKVVITLLPISTLILHFPTVLYYFAERFNYFTILLSNLSFIWVILYVIASIVLMVVEAYSVQITFFKRRFLLIMLFVFSILFLYLLYFGQNPIQIYQFYRWGNGIYYMDTALSVSSYMTIVIINVVFAVIGFTALLKYTKNMFDNNKEDIIIQRNNKMMQTGASVFVHSMKNQLLANQVIYKRLNKEMDSDANQAEVIGYIHQLREQNELMIERIDDLHQSIKSKTLHLSPTYMEDVVAISIKKFSEKRPDQNMEVNIHENTEILADTTLLSEAMYNLFINAQEAMDTKDTKEDKSIVVTCYQTRKYAVMEVKDYGSGIDKQKMKKITEPFYSTKNSNYNWGVGLYYVQSIIKEHFGILRFESEKGVGSTFTVYLPKLK
ncbi:MAG TPA: HAMP domain-containing sensor histidine kinase [Candidatus Dormibacteraeota bacterium]|nr:HAMP domain-containing sensor histidine kinase [Candidatus Dormibacteraeota bacterium]